MKMLKLVIIGQILMVLVKFHPHEELFTGEEKQDFQDLKKCAEILMHDN